MFLFVYGTLKSGLCNHHYTGQLKSLKPAWIYGRLYHLEQGYPALELPENLILQQASNSTMKDADDSGTLINNTSLPGGDWDKVYGELIELADPVKDLAKIDWLEDFECGREDNLYLRQLIPVCCEGYWQSAWTYHYQLTHKGERLKQGFWPKI